MTAAQLYALLRRWSRFRSTMLGFMEHHDAIICPVAAAPAVLHGTSTEFERATMISYTVPYNLTGWPCVVLRAGTSPTEPLVQPGTTAEPAPAGLPVGVQIVARPWREDVALALALQVEAVLGGWQRPPV